MKRPKVWWLLCVVPLLLGFMPQSAAADGRRVVVAHGGAHYRAPVYHHGYGRYYGPAPRVYHYPYARPYYYRPYYRPYYYRPYYSYYYPPPAPVPYYGQGIYFGFGFGY